MGKTLVIALDGLDYSLIKKFELDNVVQEEFGKIDNHTEMKTIKTSELFASFITGTNWENHGVEGLTGYKRPSRARKMDFFLPEFLKGFKGYYTLRNILDDIFKPGRKRYDSSMWDYETIFDQVENSRAIFVPSYNPSPYWVMEADLGHAMKFGYTGEEVLDIYDEIEYPHRKKKLFDELENDILPTRNFLMVHFHRPDTYQHVYGDFNLDEQKLKKMYHEMDELAKKIKQKALQKGYERIIFMSDHGLPAEEGHNENAFYSSNKELFGEEKPHITDFYDKFKHRG